MGEGGTGKAAVTRALHELTGRTQLTEIDVATVLADGPTAWLRTLRRALDNSETSVAIRHVELADPTLSVSIAAEIDRSPGPRTRLFATLATGASGEGLRPLLDRFSIQLGIPPLRDRRDDIEALVRCFVCRQSASPSLRFHPDTLAILRAAEFPGNVRELERLVTGLTATRRTGDVLPADLPPLTVAGPAHLTPMERAERDAIIKALQQAKGNKVLAAAALGIARQTLYRKITVFGIETV
jgi:DNA-binding NtrC family response regulator